MAGFAVTTEVGGGTHHAALAVSELAECLTWLWRDYDPKKSEQTFEQSAEEKAKPPFRVRIYNR
jgi:enterochelin esterase family protein